MGWWQVEGTDNYLGDEPLDLLGLAVEQVVFHYQTQFHRSPTRGEWESLLFAVLGDSDSNAQPVNEGVVRAVRMEVAPGSGTP